MLFCFYWFQVYITNFVTISLKTFHSVNPFTSLNTWVNFRCVNYKHMSRDNRSLQIIKHVCNKHVCLFHKHCIILRKSTKHLNNTTQLLYSINFIYKFTWDLLIEVYLWNKFLGNASKKLAAFMLLIPSFYSTMYFWYRRFAISNNEYLAIVHKSNNKISSHGDFILKLWKIRLNGTYNFP